MHYPRYILSSLLALAATTSSVCAQEPAISLAVARARALAASAEVAAAREAVAVARGFERQAGAYPNPTVSYAREQTGSGSVATSQEVVAADQQVEWSGARSAARHAARARRTAAEGRLAFLESEVAFAAARSYADAVAAERRARLADTVATAFAAAAGVSERRLAEGDISGFAARRMRLEAARYLALRADAVLQHHRALLSLAAVLGDSVGATRAAPMAKVPNIAALSLDTDSLIATAMRFRTDLEATAWDVEAARAEARRTRRDRLPPVTLTVGQKRDALAGTTMSGLVAGVALPLPLWDRRAGAIDAANAETRRKSAELIAVRRAVRHEVMDAAAALRAAQEQLLLLGPAAQSDAGAALRSAQAAYGEGEITLLEWLDTVRAYQETESTIATLRSEVIVRAAALERAVGRPIFQELR